MTASPGRGAARNGGRNAAGGMGPAGRRMLFGAIAGVAASVAMTAVMRRLWERLEPAERYPLPPREIVESLHGRADTPRRADERQASIETMAGHIGYGAATGALYGLLPQGQASGIGYGISVWAASYLGWIPAAGILEPANRHPMRRNLLMIAAHAAWGSVLAASLRELERAADSAFAPGPAYDALPVRDAREALLLAVEDRPSRTDPGV